MRLVSLTDDELVLLDGKCSPEVQVKVTDALARVVLRDVLPDLTSAQVGLVADVVSVARREGWLRYVRTNADTCEVCGRRAGFAKYRSGPRRGEDNLSKPLSFTGIDMDPGFVHIKGMVRLGGCLACVEALTPVLAEHLRGVPAQVPATLIADGEPERRRHQNRRCTECGWEGHEGEMRRERTLLGDGTYPAGCPNCDAINRPLGKDHIVRTDGFVIAEVGR